MNKKLVSFIIGFYLVPFLALYGSKFPGGYLGIFVACCVVAGYRLWKRKYA